MTLKELTVLEKGDYIYHQDPHGLTQGKVLHNSQGVLRIWWSDSKSPDVYFLDDPQGWEWLENVRK